MYYVFCLFFLIEKIKKIENNLDFNIVIKSNPCLTMVCSKFEVDVTKIVVPMRFCLFVGAIPKLATVRHRHYRILFLSVRITNKYISVTISIL